MPIQSPLSQIAGCFPLGDVRLILESADFPAAGGAIRMAARATLHTHVNTRDEHSRGRLVTCSGGCRVQRPSLRYYLCIFGWAPVVATDTTLTAVARARTPTWDERLIPDSPRTRQLVNHRQLRLPSPQHPLRQRAVILTLRRAQLSRVPPPRLSTARVLQVFGGWSSRWRNSMSGCIPLMLTLRLHPSARSTPAPTQILTSRLMGCRDPHHLHRRLVLTMKATMTKVV